MCYAINLGMFALGLYVGMTLMCMLFLASWADRRL